MLKSDTALHATRQIGSLARLRIGSISGSSSRSNTRSALASALCSELKVNDSCVMGSDAS